MVGHGGSSAGSYLADPTSPIPSHCASIVMTSTLRVNLPINPALHVHSCCPQWLVHTLLGGHGDIVASHADDTSQPEIVLCFCGSVSSEFGPCPTRMFCRVKAYIRMMGFEEYKQNMS